MQVLEYIGLDVARVKAQYKKVREAIERGDFRQAEVKKLANVVHGKFYRAKLDYANRLLFSFVRHGEATLRVPAGARRSGAISPTGSRVSSRH